MNRFCLGAGPPPPSWPLRCSLFLARIDRDEEHVSTYIDRRTAVTIVDSSGANGAASSANFVTGASPAMRALDRVIADIAPTDIPVLLMGESGTGKEAIAREIHGRSRHSRAPFLKCNGTAANLDALLAGPIAGDAGLRAGGT